MIFCNTRNLRGRLTGVQRYTSELISRLPELRRVEPDGASGAIAGHLWEQFQLPRQVGNDLLWSPANSGPLAVRRQVLSVMDLSPLDHPEWMHWKFAAWYRFLIPRLVPRVELVLTISEFSRQRILEHCPGAAGRVHVTPLAADARFSPRSPEEIENVGRTLGLPTRHYLVAVGSLEPRKNLQRVLAAWREVQQRLPEDIWLVLAGAIGKSDVFGTYRLDLPARVHLAGHVADSQLPALYSGALAAVYLSLYEGFGLPPLEAQSCGTPVLTSNTTSLPEVVGDAAVTVDPLDTDGIATAMERLCGDAVLRAKLRIKGLARASTFSWQRCAEQTWGYLQSADGKKSHEDR